MIDHELLLEDLRFYNLSAWVILYIIRWRNASVEDSNGAGVGDFRAGIISPLLANL